jgi:phage I-like protein
VDFTGTLVGQFALGEMVGNRSRVQLMQAGTFNHARFGEFTITDEHLRGFADSIKRKGDRVSIDYDHSFAENGDSRAAGWIDGQTVEVQGDSLFAEVDWTPPAADAIRNREYRFISPEFDFTTRDYRSGERVELPDFKAAALTNRPFLKEMTPVTLSEGSFLDVLDTYLLDEEQVEAAAHRYGADVAASLKTAAMHGPSNADREAARRVLASTTNKETSMNLRELAASLGLSEDADEATILAAARDAQARATALATENEELKKKVLDDTALKTLSDQAAAGAQASKRLHEMERDTLLADAVRAGKILPSQKDAYASMYDLNAEGIKTLFDATPANAVVQLDEKGGSGEGAETHATSPTEVEVDGQKLPVLESSATLHDKAIAILAADGKEDSYSEAEYLRAVKKADAPS